MMWLLLSAALLAGAPSADPVVPCTVTGQLDRADAGRALAACATARARFQQLFGVKAPALQVVLRDRPGYRVSDVGQGARVYWPTSSVLAASPPRYEAGQVAAQWREVLPHEAMHALVAAHFFPEGLAAERPDAAATGAAYGTPLADWFEEGAAIWAEPEASRRTRMAQAARLPRELRELPGILAGAHPAAADPTLLAARDGAPLPREDRALWAFYPQSIAVLSFVYESGGPAAVHALAERMVAAGGGGTVALDGLPGLPGQAADVVAAWELWLPAKAAGLTGPPAAPRSGR